MRGTLQQALFFAGALVSSLSAAEWTPEVFDYDPPVRLEVQEAPTRRAYRMSGTLQTELIFKDIRGADVPVLITLPARGEAPFPCVVLAHGFTSNKEEVTRQMGRALVERGFGCIAIDLPKHGERPGGPPKELFGPDRPTAYQNIVQAVIEIRQTIDLAETMREFRTDDGVFLAGYSMGSWIGTLAGAADRRVKAMVLMVGGSAAVTASRLEDENPGLPDRLNLVHHYEVLQHNRAIAKFAPRPILMLNGEKDLLVPRVRTEALYRAAGAPKEIRWFDAGHLLPAKAYNEGADWLLEQLKAGR
jgi:alpha-beta hydrolase superfamily lysophospholipase